jgi:hypothetical protein
LDNVKVGSTRPEVLSVFGMPKASDVEQEERTEIFEFVDGNNGASKLRIIPYVAAEVFTLGLAELVLWHRGHWSCRCSKDQKGDPW